MIWPLIAIVRVTILGSSGPPNSAELNALTIPLAAKVVVSEMAKENAFDVPARKSVFKSL